MWKLHVTILNDAFPQTTINCTIIFRGCHRQKERFTETFQTLCSVDREISEILTDENYDIESSDRHTDPLKYPQLHRAVRIDLLAFGGLMLSAFVDDYFLSVGDLVAWWRSTYIYNLTNWTVCTSMMQMVFVLRVLHQRYALINRIMARCLIGDGHRHGATDLSGIRIVHMACNRWADGQLIAGRLNRLRQLHFRLTQLHIDVTGYFGPLLIGNFMAVCLTQTITVFTFYLIASEAQRSLSVPLMIYSALWLVLYTGRLVAIPLWCERLNRQRQATAEALYRLECSDRWLLDGGMRSVGAQEEAVSVDWIMVYKKIWILYGIGMSR